MAYKPAVSDRIVITGIGVVAPNGIGKNEFWKSCFAGLSGIKPITLFDTSRFCCRLGGEISPFDAAQYLGSKGLRNLDRTTRLALVAAQLALRDARLEITERNKNAVGAVLGSTMGSVHSISEFDKEGLREGPRFVNPALFPNTVINAPASQMAIRFGHRGMNATISTGFSATLDAIGYAVNALRFKRSKILLVGGVEELCIQTFLGFYKLGLLTRSRENSPTAFAPPFDQKHNGTLLGEGAAIFVMESLEHARSRSANIYAEVLGYGTHFSSASMYRYDPSGENASTAIQRALEDAGLAPEQIDYISASANAFKACDFMEAIAIKKIFGHDNQAPVVSAIKSMLGESFSAAGALETAAALGAIHEQKAPPTLGWQQPDPSCGMNRVSGKTKDLSIDRVLINSFGPMGVSSAMVIGSVDGQNRLQRTGASQTTISG